MFLRQLDLTSALRPALHDGETLLFVQDGIGLYEGKYKIPNYQAGHTYLTSHRICYVDNDEPRKYSVAVDLKEIERTEFYAGFLKSSAKITLFPKPSRQTIRSPVPRYAGPDASYGSSPGSPSTPYSPSPAPPRDLNATWICPICGFSNAVPANFDPASANQHTQLSPCQACGIKPPLLHVVKAAIAAMSNRSAPDLGHGHGSPARSSGSPTEANVASDTWDARGITCPRCTFENFPSMTACEMCGVSLIPSGDRRSQIISQSIQRADSPGPTRTGPLIGDESIETIKLSFRAGGEKTFLERLKGALVQRKWLLQSAPPIPRPGGLSNGNGSPLGDGSYGSTPPAQRIVGIAGLEQRGAWLRETNQAVIGSAFEDLEALMTSAKEVIAMAEQFRAQATTGSDSITPEAQSLLSDSASALGLVTTKDMLGPGSSSETLYITELSRNVAEFLTDDRRGVLRREGGTMPLVDLWAVFNRTRNGIELVSPLDFERAANMWDALGLPVRLRRFRRSGLLVVQERGRTDARTVAALLAWLREPQYAFPPPAGDALGQSFGRGVTAQEAAERFGWSVGVAAEELDVAEEMGALCVDQCLDGVRFWENHFPHFDPPRRAVDAMQMMNELNIV